MNARAWRRCTTLGALVLGLTACKPEAPAETAGSPEEGPAPAAELAQGRADPSADSALASTSPGIADSADDPGALDTPTAGEADTAADGAADTAADTAADAAATASAEPALPEEPYKVLMLGDSLVATGLGALLEKKLDAHPHIVCYRKGKSSSGLARPDFYDWIDQAKRQVEFRQPDLVIVILGGNDGQDLTRRAGQDKRIPWKHEDWADGYRARMDAFLAEVTGPERKVLWFGLPYMGLRSLEKKLELIRSVQKEAVEALGETGVYFDTVPFVTTEDGEMLTTAKVGPKGKSQALRAEDKIHFTMAGSEYLALHLYPQVLEVLELPDVQPDP